jgi:predicted ribosome quality control (RQC) complex YloA/Tae2 family protein
MKLSHLRQIADYLKAFRYINAIHRVNDTTIKIVLGGEKSLYANMQKGHSYLAMCRHDIRRSKVYQAPFDVVLAKRFNRAEITGVSLYNDDKILRIEAALSGAYKHSKTVLQLEFTGKTTNAIILDEDEVVLEALRHIDADTSYRVVRVGQTLLPPPPLAFVPREYPIDDVEAYLYAVCDREQSAQLAGLKKQKSALLRKKLQRLEGHLEALEDEAALAAEAERLQHLGNLVLSNLHTIKPYRTQLTLRDYDGSAVEVTLPRAFSSAHQVSEHFFRLSKKTKQKAANMHIEREGLEGKVRHLEHFIATVGAAGTVEEITRLFPPKQQGKTREKSDDAVETFWIEGYKVQLGKNERGNIALLQRARARDIWLHLRDRPSTHVIITTDKQKVPESVLRAAAKLCADFSVMSPGVFEVDYTPRREVKIREGANVLYNKYETLAVEK